MSLYPEVDRLLEDLVFFKTRKPPEPKEQDQDEEAVCEPQGH